MKRVLLAVDDEGFAEDAVAAAMAVAASQHAFVSVLHVVDPRVSKTMRGYAETVVAHAVMRLKSAGVDAEPLYREATRHGVAQAIAQAAAETGAELIALGSHGRGDLSAMLLGSVGHRVAELTNVPLLIVRPSAVAETIRSIRRVVVAVDHSRESDGAVDLARAIAGATGAMVKVLHVTYRVAVDTGIYIEPPADANRLVEEYASALRREGIAAAGETVEGWAPAAQQIAAAAESWAADLIIVGSRRLSDLGGAMRGSTSHAVLASSDRPVIIAGRPDAVEEHTDHRRHA